VERPYRVRNEKTKANERWRCYGYLEHAQTAAYILAKRQEIGVTLAVVHFDTEKLFGQYTRSFDRRLGDIVLFRGEKNELERPANKRGTNATTTKRTATKRTKRKARRQEAPAETGAEVRTSTRH
jgi:hypothetical protein